MSENRGCLPTALARLLSANDEPSGPNQSMPEIRVSKKFISPAEVNFYRVLNQVVHNRAIILCQVAMNQLLWLPQKKQSDRSLTTSWRNKIKGKSVDFLLVNPQSFRPLVALELDEPSHAKPSRQTRDETVDQAFEAAGLPLLRVLTSRSYDTRELDETLAPYLAG